MYKILLMALVLLLFMQHGFAANEIFKRKVDLNNDRKKELVTAIDNFEETTQGTLTVSTKEGKTLGSFSLPNRLTQVKIISLNKNRQKQIVAWSKDPITNYACLAIYELKPGGLCKIFSASSDFFIKTDFSSSPAIIKVGISQPDSKEPASNIYAWDGQSFVLSLDTF